MKMYLKSNFVAEPLVDNWYAWSHLISPFTYCMNLKNKYLPILNDYIKDPESHKLAIKDPKMLGGPFIDAPDMSSDDVKKILARTLIENNKALSIAGAIEKLQALIEYEPKGMSLLPLYDMIPSQLKGFVELIYSLEGSAGFRLKESLFDIVMKIGGKQRLRMYLLEEDRPFILSTPHFDKEKLLTVDIPFNNPLIDELFSMEYEAADVEVMAKRIGIPDDKNELFRSFFTETPSRKQKNYDGEFGRMRYFGHACVCLEIKGCTVLVDPVINQYYEGNENGFCYHDLPEKIDYVLITHNHQDHILIETLLRLRSRIKTIVVPQNTQGSLQDPDLALMFRKLGFENIITLKEMEEIHFDLGRIIGIPFYGEHGDLDVSSKLGYIWEAGGYKAMFLADSNIIETKTYEMIKNIYGNMDVLFIGMECDGAPLSWMYGPYIHNKLDRETDQSRRLNGSGYDAAKSIVEIFEPNEVYIYAMGLEPWVSHISIAKFNETSNPIIQSEKLLSYCKEELGIRAERLFGEKEVFTYNKN